jgi:hypothetical protein
MQSRVSGKLGDIWWAFLLRGVFAEVLGICALIWANSQFHNPDTPGRSLFASRTLCQDCGGAKRV